MWILVCFSILSVGLYGIVSSRLNIAGALERRITGLYLAKAACVYFKMERTGAGTSFDTIAKLREERSQALGNGKFLFTLSDEESRINVNTSPTDVLISLPGFDKELAKKVYGYKEKPFRVKEELLLVEGMSEEIFEQCKGLITTYGSGGVNINTADAAVLKALGFDEGMVRAICDFRTGPDGKDGTEDDGFFADTASIINELRARSMLYAAQEMRMVQLISQQAISTSSKNFSLNIETTFLDKPAMRYNIVIDTVKDKIKRWIEL